LPNKHQEALTRVRGLLERVRPSRKPPEFPGDGRVRDAAEMASRQWTREREQAVRALYEDLPLTCAALVLHDWTADPVALRQALGEYPDIVVADASRWTRDFAARVASFCEEGELSATAYSALIEAVRSVGFRLDLKLRTDSWPDARDVGTRVDSAIVAQVFGWRYLEALFGEAGLQAALRHEAVLALVEADAPVPAFVVLVGVPQAYRAAAMAAPWLAVGESSRRADAETIIDCLKKIRDRARRAFEVNQ
jgi:hypothetical protein